MVMARPLRIEYAGAHYHVTSRGNERKAIFRGDEDREKFLELLGRAVEEFALRLHSYVLMSNHYHLLVETPKANLNRALRYLNGVYTQTFNRRHQRVGHLFQGRYKAILVDKESYLLELSRYVHLNPWRLRKSEDPWRYPWSSLGAYVGRVRSPQWLTVTEVLSYFGRQGRRGYKEFIAEGMEQGIKTPWGNVKGQAVIGSDGFLDEVASRQLAGRRQERGEHSGLREVVGIRPEVILAEVARYFGIRSEAIRRREQRYTEARYVASLLLRRYGLMSLQEIGKKVGLHYSAVGNAIRQIRDRATAAQVKSLKELESKFNNQ
jgi:REP element-mobilizing transposase RayT